MGLGFMGLAGDLKEITSIFGSRDNGRYDALMNSDHFFVRSLLGLDDPGIDATETQGALREIVDGAKCETYSPHRYGYAMEAVCFQLAENLGEAAAGYGAMDEVIQVIVEAGGDPGLFPEADAEWFVPIPRMEDWPCVVTYSADQCRKKAAALAAVARDLTGEEEDNPTFFIAEFLKWYQDCAKTNRDLIVVAH